MMGRKAKGNVVTPEDTARMWEEISRRQRISEAEEKAELEKANRLLKREMEREERQEKRETQIVTIKLFLAAIPSIAFLIGIKLFCWYAWGV